MEDERVLKQREANRRSYEKHKAARLAKRNLATPEQKTARREYLKEYRERNREQLREKDRQRWAARSERQNERQRLQRKARSKREQSRIDASAYYRKRYGITIEDYERRLLDQQGKCAICRAPQGAKRLHIDHDHSCCPNKHGKICGQCARGLLCGNCNMIVGLIEADDQFVSRLLEYLRKWKIGEE